jgi:hypothetical protein
MHDGCPIGGHAVFGPRHIVRRPIRPLDGQDDAPVEHVAGSFPETAYPCCW